MFHSWEDCKIKLRCKFYLAIHILQFRLFSDSIFLQFNKPFFEKRIRTGFWFPSHSNSFFCSRRRSHFPLFTILNANIRLSTDNHNLAISFLLQQPYKAIKYHCTPTANNHAYGDSHVFISINYSNNTFSCICSCQHFAN